MVDVLQEMVGENREVLLAAQKQVNELKAKQIQETQKKLDETLAQVKALQEEKIVLAKLPTQKKEFLRVAKKRLKDLRSEAIEEILLEHLKESQLGNTEPLHSSLKRSVTAEKNLWKLLFLSLSNQDLELLTEKLPDIGLSAKDRAANMATIDSQIEDLVSSLGLAGKSSGEQAR